jgi:hypothetical protein
MKKALSAIAALSLGLGIAAVPGLDAKIQGYSGWLRVNANAITQDGAHKGKKDVYTNMSADKLVGADGKYKGAFADGTIFVKDAAGLDSLSVDAVYVMEKAAGKWEWFVYQRKGNGFEGGKFANAAMCTGCHQGAKDDMVFTQYTKR